MSWVVASVEDVIVLCEISMEGVCEEFFWDPFMLGAGFVEIAEITLGLGLGFF